METGETEERDIGESEKKAKKEKSKNSEVSPCEIAQSYNLSHRPAHHAHLLDEERQQITQKFDLFFCAKTECLDLLRKLCFQVWKIRIGILDPGIGELIKYTHAYIYR